MASTRLKNQERRYVWLCFGFLCLLTWVCPVGSETCSLYESGAVGIYCYHGDKLIQALTNSSTAWFVEFYSSWCGHCQHFAPTMKELGRDIKAWSSIVRIGVLECSASQPNQQICSTFNVQGYPTIKMFYPNDPAPANFDKAYFGARDVKTLREIIVDHVVSLAKQPINWPNFQPLVNDRLLSLPANTWKPTILIFEDERSYIGRELILDLSFSKIFTIRRVSKTNLALVRHYSILEFPSMVVEVHKNNYHIVAGHSFQDPRTEFRRIVQDYLSKLTRNRNRSPTLTTTPPTEGGVGGHKPTHSITKITRVNITDLLGAISYAFRMEVPVHQIVSGDTFTALLRFVHLLESAFRVAYPAISLSLWSVRTKLETRQSTGFILRRDWIRIVDTKLDPHLFPKESRWSNCQGSEPHFRGYPCSLWMLMHTTTLLTLPVKARSSLPPHHRINTKDALHILSNFVKQFFSCETCRTHFSQMAQTLSDSGILHHGDAVLWLWEAHNTVNNRLKNDLSTDPFQPKVLFPSYHTCPYCYTQAGQGTGGRNDPSWDNTGFREGESMLHSPEGNFRYSWNKTAVLLFLWNFYLVDRSDNTTSFEVLHAAWPERYRNRAIRVPQSAGNDLEFNIYDIGFCLLAYLACGGLLALLAHWLVVRRRKSFLRTLLPLR